MPLSQVLQLEAKTRQPGGLFSGKTHLNIHLYSHHTSLDHLLYYETLGSRNHCTDCRRADHSDQKSETRLSSITTWQKDFSNLHNPVDMPVLSKR